MISIKTKKNSVDEIDEDYVRHLILNSIRAYRKKHYSKYGEIVICTDHLSSWRKLQFEHYKAGRKTSRTDSDIPWNEFFEIINNIIEDLIDYFPYKVIQIPHLEGDDVIATLSRLDGPQLIVSADKDFVQLQIKKDVKQWSPLLNKFIVEPNPAQFLKEHIIKGDRGDGIPNILSQEDSFVSKTRQKSVSKKYIENFDFESLSDEQKDRWKTNNDLINLVDLDYRIEQVILEKFNEPSKITDRSKVLDYFIEKNLKLLTAHLGDF